MVFVSTITCKAQNNIGSYDDLGRIVIETYISSQVEYLPPSAENLLSNKLDQIASFNGLGGCGCNARFIITPNVSVLSKDITPTAPPMMSLTLQISFFIGDGIDGTIYSSTYIESKGTGTNETKAYIAAIKQINPKNENIQNFVSEGKSKIISYYNSQCDFILKKAESLASQEKYDEAIFLLTSIPEVCKECFEKSLDAIGPIYQKQIDNTCLYNLAQAKNVWNSAQSLEAASIAIGYLSEISPNSTCFNESISFSQTILSRVKELDEREWNFMLKQEQERINNEKSMIDAARDVGAAYGNNQPQNINYNTADWWSNKPVNRQ